jgi:WD40 repeat protein
MAVEVAIFTPRPPVNLFESAAAELGTAFSDLIKPPLYAQVNNRNQVEELRTTTAILTRAKITNTSGAARTVDFRVRSSRRITYSAEVVAQPGQNWLRLDRVTRPRGVALFGWDWTDTPPTRLTNTPTALPNNATGLDWSPDSQYLAVAFDAASFRIYDATSNFALVHTSPPTTNPVRPSHVKWDPTGRYLAVGYRFADVLGLPWLRVFDFDNIAAPVEVPIPDVLARVTQRPTQLEWGGPSGRYLFIVDAGATRVAVYDWNTGSPVFAPALSTSLSTGVVGRAQGIAVSPNAARVAVTCVGGPRLLVFSFTSATVVSRVNNPIFAENTRARTPGQGAAWSPDSRYLVNLSSATTGVPFTVFDFDSGVTTLPAPPALPLLPGFQSVAWSPDGRYICFGHTESTRYTYYTVPLPYLLLYDMNSGTPVRVTSGPTLQGFGPADAVQWSPDGDTLMVGGWSYDRFYPPTGVDNVRLLDSEGNNLVVNGSFEDVTGMTRESFGFTAVGEIEGWFSDVDPGTRLFFPTFRFLNAFPTQGSVYLDVVAAGSVPVSPHSARLRQNFDELTPGGTYRFSLDVTTSLESDIGVRVLWNGTPLNILGETTLPVVQDFTLLRVSLAPGESVSVPLSRHMVAYGDSLQARASGGGVDVVLGYVLNTQESVQTITDSPDLPPEESDS